MMLTPEQLAGFRATPNTFHADAHINGSVMHQIVDHIDAQQARIAELERERNHWRSNHENQVRRARILLERPDMPIERVKAYHHMQELEQDAARYRAMRCATIAASYGLGHDPVEIEIKRAMKLSSLQGRRGELDAEEIDYAVDAAMQKDKTT